MLRFLPPTLLAASLLVLGACQRPSSGGQEEVQVNETYLSAPGSVGFDIESHPTDNASRQWLATYTANGKTAKFRIELGPAKSIKDKDSMGLDIETGEGRFVAVFGSDASVLLADLKKALEAKTLPSHPKRLNTLPFTYVTFGENQSQSPGGGFNANPAGHWTPMKSLSAKANKKAKFS